MTNPIDIISKLIEKKDKHGSYWIDNIETAIEIFENELRWQEKFHKFVFDYDGSEYSDNKIRISNLKQAIELGKRSLE
jgi:hypothetical protein